MRIGFYSPYLDTIGGGEKYVLTAAACASEQHEVSLFWEDKTIIPVIEERFGIDLSKITVVPNVFTQHSSFVTRLKATSQLDALFFLSDGSIPLSFSKKLILHMQFPVTWITGLSLKDNIKMQRVSKIVCNSYFTKHFIDKKYHVDSTVIYPPVEVEMPDVKKENIILTVGRFHRTAEGSDFKKIQLMITEFQKLHTKGYKDWKFVIITTCLPEERDALEKIIDETKRSSIEIFQDVSADKIKNLYAKSKIYWHAAGFGEDLQRQPERAEHFGISTAESMAAGAVPIVHNAGGQKEIVEDGVTGYLWDSIEELQDKTSDLIKNEARRKEISEKARTSVIELGTNRFCEQILKLFYE